MHQQQMHKNVQKAVRTMKLKKHLQIVLHLITNCPRTTTPTSFPSNLFANSFSCEIVRMKNGQRKPVVSLNKMELHMNRSVDYICTL